MKIMKTIKRKNRAKLERQIVELKGQLASSYYFATQSIDKSSNIAGSGVLLELSCLGGRKIIDPVVIVGGLSKETVEAIKVDLKRSFDYAIEFKI